MKPAETSLHKLAIVPALFAVWGAWSISHRFGASLVPGRVACRHSHGRGTCLAAAESIEADAGPQHRQYWRSADFSLLPLLVTFLVKYGSKSRLRVAVAVRQCRLQCRLPAADGRVHWHLRRRTAGTWPRCGWMRQARGWKPQAD